MSKLAALAASTDANAQSVAAVLEAWLQPDGKPRGELAAGLAQHLVTPTKVSPLLRDVAPILLEAIGDRRHVHRAAIVEALRQIALGYRAWSALARGIDDVWLNAEASPGLSVRALREPIVAAAGTWLPLLADDDVPVRMAVARLLAALPEVDATKALEQAMSKERDVLTRHNLLFALAVRGVTHDIPTSAKLVASVTGRIVAMTQTGRADPTVIDDVQELPALVPGFIGDDGAQIATLAAFVGTLYRARDAETLAKSVERGQYDVLTVCALEAQWPRPLTPKEPRSLLTDDEKRWLSPLFLELAATNRNMMDVLVTPYGLIPRGGLPRVFGGTSGAADVILGDTPAWLLARRAIDGRVSVSAWVEALRSHREIAAIVADLPTFALALPWPTEYLPYAAVPIVRGYAAYFAVVRAALELLPDAELETIAAPHRATALALLSQRGRAPTLDEVRSQLAFFDEFDLEAQQALVGALPEDQREVALANIGPDYMPDTVFGTAELRGLWYFVDFTSPALLATLVQHLTQVVALDSRLSKPKTPNEEATGKALRAAIETTFRAVGARAVSPLRAALGSKPKPAARATLELALAAAEGRAIAPAAAKPPTAKKK